MKKIICIMLIGVFCTVGLLAEEVEGVEPARIEWNDRPSVEKGALVVWTALIFTITTIVMKEVVVDGAYGTGD